MNIIVLAGGYSTERDVSLSSGGQIANALTQNGHKVLLLDPYIGIDSLNTFENLYQTHKKSDYSYAIPTTAPDLAALKKAYGNGDALIGKNVLECCKLADVVFIGLHGSIGENGQIQALFDVHAIPYTGSGYVGSLLAMDKCLSKQLMVMHEIPTAPYEIIDSENPTIKMKPPYVVKPANGGSSVGITIVHTESDSKKALEYANLYEEKILVEKFIEGREFTVGVLDGVALPSIEIIPKNSDWFDYSSKYQGTTDEICPADIPASLEQKLRSIALKTHNTLRLKHYSRTDFIVDNEGNIFCLEANSLPGMTPASLVPQQAAEAGIKYNELCEKIVTLALNKVEEHAL